MMHDYHNGGDQKGITGYEIYPDRIFVRFKGGKVYGYSYESAGRDIVEEMKKLALAEDGLTRYIRQNVGNKFFFKGEETDPLPVPVTSEKRIEEKGIAKMPSKLRSFDYNPYLDNISHHDTKGYMVYYAATVDEKDKVPGLIDVIEEEYERILSFVPHFLSRDFGGWNLSIELSDLHVVASYGTMTDSDIVNAIKDLFKREVAPNVEQIREILSKGIEENTVSGTYHPEERYIKLYYRMFDVNNGPDMYLAQIRNTLAHEVLHAIHHRFTNSGFVDDTMEAVRVKEALADFFAFCYSLDSNYCIWGGSVFKESLKVAKKCYGTWIKKYGGSWPYAYSLKFLPEGDAGFMPFSSNYSDYDICREKYQLVFEYSIGNMRHAYLILMH